MSEITELGTRLFRVLDKRQIRYCQWKNCETIKAGLLGEDDLDLLVAHEDAQSLIELLTSLGFREAVNPFMAIPFVCHFYGLDEETGRILHIHLYLKLYTGESHTKNYHFPFERHLLGSSSRRVLGCPVPSCEWQLLVYLIRYYLKISCGIGWFLQRKRQSEFEEEYAKIVEELDEARWMELSSSVGGPLNSQTVEALRANYNNKVTTPKSVLIGLALRWRLLGWLRFGVIRAFVLRYWQVVYRTINKAFFHRRKKLIRGGAIIAVTGFDGTGKTTTCYELEKWFGKQFDVRLAHFGRPGPRLITLPIRAMLYLYRIRRRRRVGEGVAKSSNKGIVAAVRYVALAYERYAVLRRAAVLRDKGYIVILDRYPSLTIGGMDSPQLRITSTSTGPYRILAAAESGFYSAMPEADLLLQLEVPIEIALQRNRDRQKKYKETDEELRARHKENYGLEYSAERSQVVNVAESLETTMKRIKAIAWSVI